jgi:hypothetical protein
MNRLPVIATVAAGLLIAGLPPAVAAAASDAASCTQWGFNGGTSIFLDSGNSLSFSANGPSIGQLGIPTHAVATIIVGTVGPREVDGSASGGITGDQITVGFSALQHGIDFQLTGQVSPDGSAHGTGWEMDSQLKCMSNAT